jgi:hypothetical protein
MEGHTITRGELEHRFQFHPDDSDNKKDAHQGINDACLEAADKCVELTGAPSPEQSLAVRKFEEGMFWFQAALARGDGPRA